jgi:hypothetical protein
LRAAEVPIFASGSGAHLVRELVLDVDPDRVAVDADALPSLFTRLRTELAG